MQNSQYIGPEDSVFCKPDGSSYHPDVLRKDVLYPALDRLDSTGFSDVRFSCSSPFGWKHRERPDGEPKVGSKSPGAFQLGHYGEYLHSHLHRV